MVGFSRQKERILVVDDSPDNLFLIQTILQEQGYTVLLAGDGLTALDKVRQYCPQLILLDVMMPRMDGFEVTRQIRQDPNLPFIPILLITAYDYPSAVKGLDAGADDFIRKPVDIDELLARVRSLLRLKQSVDEREQMVRMRDDFVSRLTHDLRTPLVAAERMLNLLQQGALGNLSAPMGEAITTMIRSNHNLLEMVNTLLEVYRYQAECKVLNFTEVNIVQLVCDLVAELKPWAKEKGIYLEFENLYKSDVIIVGDRLELNRLFTNLIGNGIKFTEEGGVKVSINLNGKSTHAVFRVEDTGPGISKEEQQWLFDRFRSGSNRQAGSGLGLHLSRQIVESHHGTIEVQSELGKGSLFIVLLPLNANNNNTQLS